MSLVAPPYSRLYQLYQVSSRIFNTTLNPTNQRLGNKVFRKRMLGPSLQDYYLPRGPQIKDLRKAFPGVCFPDEDEYRRVLAVEKTKARGKGPPTKKKEKTARGGKRK